MISKIRYTDIHTHILPGVDDGAEDIRECIEMLLQSYKGGVRHVYMTPHGGARNENMNPEKLRQVFESVQALLSSRAIDLRLDLGCENYYSPGTATALRRGEAMCLGKSKYALIEFSPGVEYKALNNGLRNIVEAGYRPILAHAERCSCLYKKQKYLEELIDQGVYIQINANSFNGDRFNQTTRWCLKLFDEDLVHFIASDCHDREYRRPNIWEAADKLFGRNEQIAQKIFIENPEHIRNNTFI